jgi:hypothetical protein
MIQTRTQFKSWIRSQFNEKNMDKDGSPVWCPEHDLEGVKCEWFVTVPCVRVSQDLDFKSNYWTWCSDNLTGVVRCFWSNNEDDEECWGFTEFDDINWWLLRWVN